MQLMKMDESFLSRGVNEGFSGGEKKRNEILQMLVLEPKLAVLDETDSGLDIDALKIVAAGVNSLRSPERGILLVTHYQRLLDYVKPDRVHVLAPRPDPAQRRTRAGARARETRLRLAARRGGMSAASFKERLQADFDETSARLPTAIVPIESRRAALCAPRGARPPRPARRCLPLLEPSSAAVGRGAADGERFTDAFRCGARPASPRLCRAQFAWCSSTDGSTLRLPRR